MLRNKSIKELLDHFGGYDDSPFLAKRLRNLAKNFQNVDADKEMLCNEAALNLESMYRDMYEMLTFMQKESPVVTTGRPLIFKPLDELGSVDGHIAQPP